MVVSIIIGLSVFFLELYAFTILDINPFEGEGDVITFRGEGLEAEFGLTMEELKSDNYLQVSNQEYNFENSVGRQYTETYSGASIWSILEFHDLLLASPEELSFTFLAEDGFQSPQPLQLSLARDYPEQVILAYAVDGQSLTDTGPVRAIIDYEVIPDLTNTQFAVQKMQYIEINFL